MIDDIELKDLVRLLNALSDAHEPETMDHARRCRESTIRIATQLGIKGMELRYMGYAADIHDIGKVGISSDIIRNPGQLTHSERAAIETHCDIGYRALTLGGVPKLITEAVLYHQEHWDGSGYPEKLEGIQIPVGARIICIADMWDALLSQRPYRPAKTFKEGLEIMNENINWFDPEIYAIWIKLAYEEKHG